MDIEVNYKNKKRYKTARYPAHQTKFWTGLIWVLSRCALIGKEYKVGVVVKVNYSELRKHLESNGILKGLASGF